MRAERNILAIEVYPYLRKFCSQLGLDFQVVDMRWGVTEVSQNDHSVEKLCLLEVENCQKTSRGPNFVVKFSAFNSFCQTEYACRKFRLTHFCLEIPKRVIGKQCRPRYLIRVSTVCK